MCDAARGCTPRGGVVKVQRMGGMLEVVCAEGMLEVLGVRDVDKVPPRGGVVKIQRLRILSTSTFA